MERERWSRSMLARCKAALKKKKSIACEEIDGQNHWYAVGFDEYRQQQQRMQHAAGRLFALLNQPTVGTSSSTAAHGHSSLGLAASSPVARQPVVPAAAATRQPVVPAAVCALPAPTAPAAVVQLQLSADMPLASRQATLQLPDSPVTAPAVMTWGDMGSPPPLPATQGTKDAPVLPFSEAQQEQTSAVDP